MTPARSAARDPAVADDPAHSASEAPSRRGGTERAAAALVVATTVVLSWRLLRFIGRKQANILFHDQWDFYRPVFEGQGIWTLFRWQHGPPRLGVGLVLDGLIARLTHWNLVLDAVVAGVLVVASVAVALLLKVRLVGRLDWWDALIPVMFLTLRSFEIFVITPDMGHGPAPLLLLMLYVLCLTSRRLYVRIAGLVILNFLLVYTGFGLFVGLVTPVILAVEIVKTARTRSAGLAFLCMSFVLALVSLASFFVGYTFSPAVTCFQFPHPRPLEYLRFAELLLSMPFGWLGDGRVSSLVGAIAVAALAFVMLDAAWKVVAGAASWEPPAAVLTLSAYTVLFGVNAAIGRVCQGVLAAQSSRYVLYLVPGLYAVYLALRLRSGRAAQLATVALAVLLVSGEMREHAQNRDQIKYYCRGKARWQTCFLERRDVRMCDRLTRFAVHPAPDATDLSGKLEYFRRNRLSLFAAAGTDDDHAGLDRDEN